MVSRRLDILVVALLSAYVSVAISLLWRHPCVLALLLAWPPVILGMRVGDPRRAVVYALTGLVLGPLTEGFCIAGGLWTYAETGGLPLAPLWILPLWACFPAALWLVARSILGAQEARFDPLRLALCLLGLAAVVALCIRLGHSTTLTLLFLVPAAALVFLATRRAAVVVILVSGALIGPFCESLPIAAHAWSYALPQVLGMPAWLPAGYAVFAVLVALAAEQVSAAVRVSPADQKRTSVA